MNQLQANFSALAEGVAGAPALVPNSLMVTGVASVANLNVSSRSTTREFISTQQGSVAALNVSSAFRCGSDALIGGLNPFEFAPRIKGLVPSNAADATNDITLSVGYVINADGVVASLDSTLTKRADATHAAGDGAGGMRSGHSFTADTTYHLHIISRNSDGLIDAYFDTDIDGANVPSGWTMIGRAASLISGTGPAWRAIECDETAGSGLWLRYKAAINELLIYNGSTARQTKAITVPAGLRVRAMLHVDLTAITASVSGAAWVESTNYTDAAADTTNGAVQARHGAPDDLSRQANHVERWTDTSRTIAHRQSSTSVFLSISTGGYIDERRAA